MGADAYGDDVLSSTHLPGYGKGKVGIRVWEFDFHDMEFDSHDREKLWPAWKRLSTTMERLFTLMKRLTTPMEKLSGSMESLSTTMKSNSQRMARDGEIAKPSFLPLVTHRRVNIGCGLINPYFEKLGRAVADRWQQENFSLEVLPELARIALDEFPPSENACKW
jgi:hypothetical protein